MARSQYVCFAVGPVQSLSDCLSQVYLCGRCWRIKLSPDELKTVQARADALAAVQSAPGQGRGRGRGGRAAVRRGQSRGAGRGHGRGRGAVPESQETSDESDGAASPSPRQSRVSGGGHGRGRGAVPESQGTSDESDEADARADLDAETLLAIRRSLEESCGTDRQRKRSARQKSLGVDSDEFSNMSESDLRYHKYAELKLEWQDKHPGRVIPNGISYTLHEQAQAWADGVVLRKEHKTD